MKIIATLKEIHDCCIECDANSRWHSGAHFAKPDSWADFCNKRGYATSSIREGSGGFEVHLTPKDATSLGLIPPACSVPFC